MKFFHALPNCMTKGKSLPTIGSSLHFKNIFLSLNIIVMLNNLFVAMMAYGVCLIHAPPWRIASSCSPLIVSYCFQISILGSNLSHGHLGLSDTKKLNMGIENGEKLILGLELSLIKLSIFSARWIWHRHVNLNEHGKSVSICGR